MKTLQVRLAYAFLVLTMNTTIASTVDQQLVSLELHSTKDGEKTQAWRGVLSPERMSSKETKNKKQNALRGLWTRQCCFDGKCRGPGEWLSSQNTGMRCMCDQSNPGRWTKCQKIQECCFNGKCKQPGQWLSSKKLKCLCDQSNTGQWTKCQNMEKKTRPPYIWTTEQVWTTEPPEQVECCVGRKCRQPGQWLTSQGLSCRCDTKNSGRWVECDEIETTTTTPRSPCYDCPRNSRLKSFQCSNTFRDCECRSGFIEDGSICVAETTTPPSFCGAQCDDDDDCDPDAGCSNCDWKTKVCEPRRGGTRPSNSNPGFTGGFESDRGGLLRLRKGDRLYMAVNDRNGVFFSRSVKQRWEYVDGHLKNKSLGNSHCLTYDNIESVEINARLFMRRCTQEDPAEWRVLKINGRRHIQSVSNRLCIDVRNSIGNVATLAKCRSSRANDQAFEDSSFLS